MAKKARGKGKTPLAGAEARIAQALRTGSTELHLGGLGLTELPQSLGQLTDLRTLSLDNNDLMVLPDALGQLTQLRRLQLHANRLSSVPSFVRQLAQLQVLSIGDNGLAGLPEWLGELAQLRELYLPAIGIAVVPHFVAHLAQLRILVLNRNGLTTLPQFLSRLTRLEELHLDANKLTAIPAWLGRMNSLQTLSVSGNGLTSVPESLGYLRQLQTLDLSRNQLASVPESLGRLKMLGHLFLHGNERLDLPAEILGPTWQDLNFRDSKPAKPADILDYYFRTRLEKRALNEAKVILLGRGEVGKTCLVNRLVYNKFTPTSETHGIQITQWPVKIARDVVRLHVWDFGGQEIQHATHQFFLTERSLYLVVLDGRAGVEDEDAEYWLKFVRTFGGGSPTVVVLNKVKTHPFEVNRRALQKKYPFICAFVETDCKPKTGNGIPKLMCEIKRRLGDMPDVWTAFPARWFQIKDRLAQMKEPFIPFEKYRQICSELGENDPEAQESLSGFLNALGVALNYRADPRLRDDTVLNPHWITKGVYRIITSKALAKQQGELRLEDLTSILPKRAYPERMHVFLIELMRRFELCFPYHDDPKEHHYLVPELLGKEQPAFRDPFPPAECLNFRYEYGLMPEGLLPRFITRTHTMSRPAERWRTGVVLRWEGCRALVTSDKEDGQVLVRVQGEPWKRRRLLAVIRENFDRIHAEMRDFKPAEGVALEKYPDEWISYRDLEVFEQKRIKEMPKTVGDDVVAVDVTRILNETDVPRGRQRGEDIRAGIERPLRLFISYAHEDEKWRTKLAHNLGLLEREGLVEVWCDLQIVPGATWDEEIKRKLNEADLYVFLMSTDLLDSEYVQNTELPIARKRHDGKKARLIPVVVRSCSWKRYVGDVQGLPKDGRPVAKWGDKDEAFFDVEQGLRKTIAEMHKVLGRP